MNENAIRYGTIAALVAAFGYFLYYTFRRREISSESGAYIASSTLAGGDEIIVGAPGFKAPTVPQFKADSEIMNATKSGSDAGVTIARTTRGLRNKNPGNIRWIANASSRWRGMIANDGTNYAIFESDALGVRALAKQLLVYYNRDALQTVRGIITKWAPPSENVTSAYVTAVAKALSVGPDTIIDVNLFLPNLVVAVIKHENGVQPYKVADIHAWIEIP